MAWAHKQADVLGGRQSHGDTEVLTGVGRGEELAPNF